MWINFRSVRVRSNSISLLFFLNFTNISVFFSHWFSVNVEILKLHRILHKMKNMIWWISVHCQQNQMELYHIFIIWAQVFYLLAIILSYLLFLLPLCSPEVLPCFLNRISFPLFVSWSIFVPLSNIHLK